ncbi:MAG: putative dephospho-CoA kinase [Pseudomonadota bacterium]
MKTPVVVLTGGMGMGKSTACSLLQELGIEVVDADSLAHQLTQPDGEAIAAIEAVFGRSVIRADGGLDRPAMRARAFESPGQRVQLESILHPLIQAAAQEALGRARGPYCVYAVPLWAEVYGHQRPDWAWRVVTLDLPTDIQLARIRSRGAPPDDELQAMLDRQASRRDRRQSADLVIDNRGSLDDLRREIRALHTRLVSESPSKQA